MLEEGAWHRWIAICIELPLASAPSSFRCLDVDRPLPQPGDLNYGRMFSLGAAFDLFRCQSGSMVHCGPVFDGEVDVVNGLFVV